MRNRAQLAYSRVGPWLDARGNDTKNVINLRSDSAREHDSNEAALSKMNDSSRLPADWLAEQLKLLGEATEALHRTQDRCGGPGLSERRSGASAGGWSYSERA